MICIQQMPIQHLKPALEERDFAALSTGTFLFVVSDDVAKGLLVFPTWGGVVARGGGHGGEVGVFSDGGFCFCGFVLGGEEVGLGFVGTHCEGYDSRCSCFLL